MDYFKISILFLLISLTLVAWNWLVRKFYARASFFWTSSWLFLLLSSCIGVWLTSGKTVMTPMLVSCLGSFFYFMPRVENNQQNKSQILFFISSFLFYQFLYWFIFTFFTVNGMNFLHRDYQFYINKVATIAKIGVENSTATIFDTPPIPSDIYHYFDFYIYWIFINLKSFLNLDEIIIGVVFPLFAGLFTTNMFVIIQRIFPHHAQKVSTSMIILILPLIIPLYDIFYGWDYIRKLSFSLFTHPKLLFLGFLISVLLSVYQFGSRVWLYTFGLVFSITFITLLPYVLGFLVLVLSTDIFRKDFKIKQLILPIFFGLLCFVWIYYLYGQSTLVNVQTSQIRMDAYSSLIRRMSIIRDSFVIIFTYTPFILIFAFTRRFNLSFRLKRLSWDIFFIPLLSIVFGIIAWVIFHFRFSDANQFFYGVYPVVMTFAISYIIFSYSKKIHPFIPISFFIISFFVNVKDRINFLDGNTKFDRVDNLEDMYISSSDFKKFILFMNGFKTDKFFFIKDDPSLYLTEYRQPAYFFYKFNYPFFCYNLHLPKTISEKEKPFLNNHAFFNFYKQSKSSSESLDLSSIQREFAKKHGINLFISRDKKQLSKIVRGLPHKMTYLKTVSLYVCKINP